MRLIFINSLILSIACSILLTSFAFAQTIEKQHDINNPDDHFWAQVDEKVKQMEGRKGMPWQSRRLEKLRQAKLENFLELDEQSLIEFRASYRTLRKQVNELRRKRHQTIMKLSRKVKQDRISKAEIENNIDKVNNIHSKIIKLENQFVVDLLEILSPQQVARYIIFHDRFEHEIAKQVRDFRKQKGKRKLDSLSRKINKQ